MSDFFSPETWTFKLKSDDYLNFVFIKFPPMATSVGEECGGVVLLPSDEPKCRFFTWPGFPLGWTGALCYYWKGSEFQLPLQLQLGPGWKQEKISSPGFIGALAASSLEEMDSLSLSSAKGLDCIVLVLTHPRWGSGGTLLQRSGDPDSVLVSTAAWHEICQGWKAQFSSQPLLIPSCGRKVRVSHCCPPRVEVLLFHAKLC